MSFGFFFFFEPFSKAGLGQFLRFFFVISGLASSSSFISSLTIFFPFMPLPLENGRILNKKTQNRYIAMQASMASGVVDICLIPEVPFTIPRLCAAVETVLDRQGHCVVCVAEGAGQDLTRSGGGGGNGNGSVAHGTAGTDASGNPILEDVGAFLKSAFKRGVPGCDCKYIGARVVVDERRERESCGNSSSTFSSRSRSP